MTSTATQALTDEYKREAFLDWFNNYLSTEKFAEHYSLTIEEANTLIKEGRELHEAAVADQPDRKAAIERGRKFHQERVTWLSASVPKFACGTPVDAGIKERLLTQSKQRLAGPECLLAWDAYNEPSLVRVTALKKQIEDRKPHQDPNLIKFGDVKMGQTFIRSGREWRRTNGAFATRVDLVGTGTGEWPVPLEEMVFPIPMEARPATDPGFRWTTGTVQLFIVRHGGTSIFIAASLSQYDSRKPVGSAWERAVVKWVCAHLNKNSNWESLTESEVRAALALGERAVPYFS